jgi:hypothetical protein
VGPVKNSFLFFTSQPPRNLSLQDRKIAGLAAQLKAQVWREVQPEKIKEKKEAAESQSNPSPIASRNQAKTPLGRRVENFLKKSHVFPTAIFSKISPKYCSKIYQKNTLDLL